MTIGGLESAAELQDFLTASDQANQNLAATFAQYRQDWAKLDPIAYDDWHADYGAYLDRYASARGMALAAIIAAQSSIVPMADNPIGDPPYHMLERAIKQVDGTITKGDRDDLIARLAQAGASNVTVTPIDQPTAGDTDQGLLNKLAPLDPIGNPKTAKNWTMVIVAGVVLYLIAGPVTSIVTASLLSRRR